MHTSVIQSDGSYTEFPTDPRETHRAHPQPCVGRRNCARGSSFQHSIARTGRIRHSRAPTASRLCASATPRHAVSDAPHHIPPDAAHAVPPAVLSVSFRSLCALAFCCRCCACRSCCRSRCRCRCCYRSCSMHHQREAVGVPPDRRHRSEQYFTDSQSRSHFFRHVNGRPQATQSLDARSDGGRARLGRFGGISIQAAGRKSGSRCPPGSDRNANPLPAPVHFPDG